MGKDWLSYRNTDLMTQIMEAGPEVDVFSDKTILVVDGSKMMRQAIGDIFDLLRCQVLQAANEQEVLAHLRQADVPIHLVLLEIDDFFHDGMNILQHVQMQAPESKIMMMLSCNREMIHASTTHSILFLQKPFSMHDLIDQAQRLLAL